MKQLLSLIPDELVQSVATTTHAIIAGLLGLTMTAGAYYITAENTKSMQAHNIEEKAHPHITGEIAQVKQLIAANGTAAAAVQVRNIKDHTDQDDKLEHIEELLIELIRETKKR